MQTFTETEHKRLVKKFHALLSRYGIDNDTKLDILQQYSTDSSTHLTNAQLLDVCASLERANSPEAAELDRGRKRLIAAIGGWLRAMNRAENINLIKRIACRASGKASLNAIPKEQLNSLYYAFKKKSKDLQMVENLTIEELDILTLAN
jgi:hypothetical protein